ncbi:MAG: hypothetical protein HOF76_08160 [Candidatus Scalindua sp.]|jgi:hypothetical protein|nr:hypothetical protein [Candidatus Scalindua sp.]
MKKILTISLLVFVVATTGCSINHPVAIDYDQHLVKYGSETTLPKTELESEYLIGAKTKNHNYQFRAVSVGYAHVWIVEFGKILDKTVNSDYVQAAFGKLYKSLGGAVSNGNLIEFELENFEFKNYRAYTSLRIKVKNDGKEIFNKTYRSEGGLQGGQMWGLGPFGMKNATLKSIKQSIDKILKQFIDDINESKLALK